MSLKEAAAREAVLKTLLDAIDAEYKTARAETQRLLDAAAEETGTRQATVSLPGGPDIATVSLTGSSSEARVTGPDKFTAWVVENYGALTATGGTEWVDTETGVVHEVPGVETAPSRARSHSVRFKKDGRDQVMRAWREGRLAAVVLPELTAGGAE